MTTTASDHRTLAPGLQKSPTGIDGLDEITGGGLPRGRPTLVCGGPGCGKTLLAMEFLLRGVANYDEPGVLMAFEETAEELAQNVRSLGFDLGDLVERGKLVVDYVRIEPSEIDETGDYNLDGLFIRLTHAIDTVGARRVVLDTIETLFGGLSNQAILRGELRRLFRWLKDKGVTAIVTGERGQGALTRQGLEEYVSDCVILLDHRVIDQISTRRLRIVKYRGSAHGTNEYPFLIDQDGINVLPITSLSLEHEVSDERIPTGIPGLDAMLAGGGYFRGSTVLVSGTPGAGKSSVAANFVDAACRRGERCLYFTFEESPAQITRNMRSIGLDLEPWVRDGLLKFQASRSALYGLEMHLATCRREIERFDPKVVVVDPIGTMVDAGTRREAIAMLARLIDFLKARGITALLISLTAGDQPLELTDVDVSSTADTWLLLRDIELGGERNRAMYVLKSRGMAHSNQMREFRLTDRGIELAEAHLGPDGVLTGSARVAREARERADALVREQEIERRGRVLERKRRALEARIEAMRLEFAAEEEAAARIGREEQLRQDALAEGRKTVASSRRADAGAARARPRKRPGGRS